MRQNMSEDVSTFGGHAYDALMILAQCHPRGRAMDKEKVRTAIEHIKGVVGTAGIIQLLRQRTITASTSNAFEMLTVKDGKFALLEK